MLTKEELKFIEYWEQKRSKKRFIKRQLLINSPIAILLVIAIFLTFYTGWYHRAAMVSNANPSIFIILFISGLLIVAFFTFFSSYRKWEENERRYRELIIKGKYK